MIEKMIPPTVIPSPEPLPLIKISNRLKAPFFCLLTLMILQIPQIAIKTPINVTAIPNNILTPPLILYFYNSSTFLRKSFYRIKKS